MKALLTPAILAVAALMSGTILVLTCAKPPSVPSGLIGTAVDQNFSLSTPAAIGLYHPTAPLLPDHGVRQTKAQSTIPLLPSRSAVLSEPRPLDLDNLPTPRPPLLAGVYQTYPYTIIIIVPERGIDGRSIIGTPDIRSPMPIIKPHVEVVPKP